ncbi:hypothetical protein TNCV_2875431 [Trichonephila clavipes]|nr:hypothetical protein TNCV_2875431 [Trichonephila clavipes]
MRECHASVSRGLNLDERGQDFVCSIRERSVEIWRASDYLSTRVVDFVLSASERSVEIGIQRLPLNERGQVFVLHP